jgi:starch synthase
MVASEATPLAKSGGLGDVVGALPAALSAIGVETAVVLPRYRSVSLDGARRVYGEMRVWLSGGYYVCDVYQIDRQGVPHFLIDCPPLYDRDGFYGHRDDAIRFAVLSRAALEVARTLFRCDVLHCHDWQSGLAPLYLREFYPGDPALARVRSVMTIHSLEHQGKFGYGQLAEIGLDPRYWRSDLLEMYGEGSTLKAGIVYADAVSTVSPNYAREIQTAEYGFGMDGLLRARSGALHGILNGADYSEWNPETDRYLAANYSAADIAGKRECKAALLGEFGFDVEETIDRPLVGIVSRLAGQKGFDLISQVFHEFTAEDITVIALGSGEYRIETMLWHMEQFHRRKVRAYLGYSEALAHRIYAGSDLFLMPSRYEPCGLSQLYAMRYGTLPVVRATGGLDDTVTDETGFKFWGYNGWEMLLALRFALGVYRDGPVRWRRMREAAMQADFSWTQSGAAYRDLYARL